MQAVILAHDQLKAGTNSVMVAGGMESMSGAPHLLLNARQGIRLGHAELKDHMFYDGLEDAYTGRAMGSFAQETANEKGLTREQMSVQARIMGIADIFEALTAKDRPYKQGMTLSQAMAIMHKFKLGGHIDPDLFDVFVEQRIYQRYAEMFLDPWQIDEVNPKDWAH